MLLKPGQTILFQGDSVTDCHRNAEGGDGLGTGYPALVAAALAARCPSMGIRVVNRGISGNRARDLRARWSEDAVALQPDFLSILIGINDTWRRYDRSDPTTADAFAEDYDAILARTKAETSAKLLLLDPFVLPCPPDRKAWREDLDPKIVKVRELAARYSAIYIPMDGLFAAAAVASRPETYAADGVHPTLAGHMLIADAVLAALGVR